MLLAAASATTAQPQNLNRLPVTCKGEPITRIDIDASPPFRITGNGILQRAGRFVAKQHVETRTSVIRRFLALQLGDRCTEVRRAESERILRVQPFLADASVLTYSDGNGGIILSVSTVDEVSVIFGLGVGGGPPAIHSVLLGDDNVLGSAVHIDGSWKHGEHFRDTYAARFVDYQFLGRPYQLGVVGGQRDLGSDWATELAHPFLTDLQRLSWRTTAGSANGYFYFRRPDAQSVAIKLDRSYSDIGGVVRIGPPLGRLALFGGSISFEDEDPGTQPVLIDGSIVNDTSSALINRYTKHQTARINALVGIRNLHFLRVSGFNALEGTEDLRTGVQLATLIGKGVTVLRGKEADWFGSADFYAGAASPLYYMAIGLSAEARRDLEGRWDGILTANRAAFYFKPLNRHTFMSDLTYSGGWRQRIPFQLTFADHDGGLRGFKSTDVGGGTRVVGKVEDRYLIGRYKQLASVAVAGFAEAGKLWAGDTPFGVTTQISGTVGFSLLASTPPNSRRIGRLDVAFPVRGPTKHKWDVRITFDDLTRVFRIEPKDVLRNRERSIPSSVFSWP